MWKHKNKERNSFELKLEKILTWKYSDQFWYFGHIFLLRYLIDLILAATERGLEDLKLCSLQKLQNLQYSRPKPTWKLTYCWKREIDFFYFSFLGACVFRVLTVIYTTIYLYYYLRGCTCLNRIFFCSKIPTHSYI